MILGRSSVLFGYISLFSTRFVMFPSIRFCVFCQPFEIPAPQTQWRYSGPVTWGSIWLGSAGSWAAGINPHVPAYFDQALVISPSNFSLFLVTGAPDLPFAFQQGAWLVLSLSSCTAVFPVPNTGVEILNVSACLGLRAQKAVASAHSSPCFYSASQWRHLGWVWGQLCVSFPTWQA